MRTLDGVLRLLLSPKWLTWHVLTLGAMATCGFLAVWQWGRAGSAMGSAVNVGYGLQWPLFAVFFAYMWWRFLRMEIAALRKEPSEPPGGTAAGDDAAAPGTAQADTARATPATQSAGTAAVPEVPAPGGGSGTGGERRSPFTPRPAGVEMPRHTDPQLRAYNDELARLTARHEKETST